MDFAEVLLLGVIFLFTLSLTLVILDTGERSEECKDRGGKYYDGLCLNKDFLVEESVCNVL